MLPFVSALRLSRWLYLQWSDTGGAPCLPGHRAEPGCCLWGRHDGAERKAGGSWVHGRVPGEEESGGRRLSGSEVSREEAI